MNDDFDQFDSLIDQALESYLPTAPRPGLDQRVLCSIASSSAASHTAARTWTRTLAWAITAAAVLVGAAAIPFLLQFPGQHSAAHQHSQVAQIEHPRRFIAAPTNPAGHVPPHQRPDATHREPIHLFAQSRPRPDSPFTLAPLLNKPVTDEPIEIKPITVAPIEIAALN